MNMKYLLTAISLFVLTSCGGGGGGGGAPAGGAPAASNFNGVAVDGYLYQARAFLDLNGNGQYDNGEPTATTDANGAFTLSATQDQINSHSVVVSAIAGTTIDQDNPNTPLASGMTLIAPAGNPSVVSPLTTQVSAKMAGGLSLADAKSAVQTELGLPNIDVMKNFVAEKATNAAYVDAHKVAVSVAEVLKNIETQFTVNTTLANRFSSLTTTVTSQVAPNVTQIKAAASVDDAKTVMTTAISQAANIYSIGGSISGLTASGLVLANGVGTFSPSSGANSFTFSSRKVSGAAYAVTVQSNPTGQVCTVSNGSGTIGIQSITNVSVACTNTPGALGGTITGLNTSGLVLKNGSDELTVASGSSTFQFPTPVASAATYAVTVKTQPTGKTCTVSRPSGTMVSAGVTNVQVTCVLPPPSVTIAPPSNPQPTRTVLSFDAQIDKLGVGYWVVSQNSQIPTVEQILSGKDSSGQVAELYGSSPMTANVISTFTVAPLLYEKSYNLFFLASADGTVSTSSNLNVGTFNSPPPVLTRASWGQYIPYEQYGASQAYIQTDTNGRSYVLRSDVRWKITTYSGQFSSTNQDVDFVGLNQGTPLDGVGTQAIFNTVNYMCYHTASNTIFLLDGADASQTLRIRQINLTSKQVTTHKTLSLPDYGTYGSNISYYSNSIACSEKMLFLGVGPKLVRYDIQSKTLTTIADLWSVNRVDLVVFILPSDLNTLYISSPRGGFSMQIP